MNGFDSDRILIVDDDESVLTGEKNVLLINGFLNVELAASADDMRAILTEQDVAVVLLDLVLRDESGLDLLPWIQENSPQTQIIVVTGANETATAVRCMRSGAIDYIVKGHDTERIPAAVRNAMARRRAYTQSRRITDAFLTTTFEDRDAFSAFITRSEAMERIFRYITAMAPLPDPILITGETGVGKEVLARAVHQQSGRMGELITLNLGGMEDGLVSDTLFGHRKGAYTGADTRRAGILHAAEYGTVLLDEVGDAPAATQIKLLRLVETGEYYPLGSDNPERTNARLIFATNMDLEKGVAQGRFRHDLYYRISSHHIRIPPLRERPEDIAPILQFLVARNRERIGMEAPPVPAALLADLRRDALLGNVRELENLVVRAIVEGSWGEIYEGARLAPEEDKVRFGPSLPSPQEVVEALLMEAERRHPGNKTAAAAALGLSPQAYANRMRRVGRTDEFDAL